jgi:predicted metal-dependent HD superfamily phosphohydrolase
MVTNESGTLPPSPVAPMNVVPQLLRNLWFVDIGSAVGGDEVLDELVSRYAEPHRCYHATSHVIHVLNHLPHVLDAEGIAADSHVARSLRLALWYHDAIYNVRSATNEAYSAALAVRELAGLGVEDSLCADVSRLVMATKHPSNPASLDEAIIVDVDLGILATSQENYDQYVSQVRREYSHVSDADWRIGRARVLASFLDADKLFYTTSGEVWHPIAIRNIQRELHSLAS